MNTNQDRSETKDQKDKPNNSEGNVINLGSGKDKPKSDSKNPQNSTDTDKAAPKKQ